MFNYILIRHETKLPRCSPQQNQALPIRATCIVHIKDDFTFGLTRNFVQRGELWCPRNFFFASHVRRELDLALGRSLILGSRVPSSCVREHPCIRAFVFDQGAFERKITFLSNLGLDSSRTQANVPFERGVRRKMTFASNVELDTSLTFFFRSKFLRALFATTPFSNYPSTKFKRFSG